MQCKHDSLEKEEKWDIRDYTDVIVTLEPAIVTVCSCGLALDIVLDGKPCVMTSRPENVEIARVRDIQQEFAVRAKAYALDVFEPSFKYPSARIKAIKVPVRKRVREEVHRENEVLERTQGSVAVIKNSAKPRFFGKLNDSDTE
jgi:hypothetical protein